MVYDINLIPTNKRNSSGKTGFLMLLVGLFCAVVLLVFFFSVPLQRKLSLAKRIQAQEEELSTYANIQEEYLTLTEQVGRLNRTVKALEDLKSSKVKLTAVMDDIEKCTPKNITASRMSLEDGLITIEGTSPTYKEIAQFMVNLRKADGVLSVTFKSAAAEEERDEASGGAGSGNGYGGDQIHDFTMYVKFDIKDIVSELQLGEENTEAGTEATESGTEEEAVQDEAD